MEIQPYSAPHPYTVGCNCGRCSARNSMLSQTVTEQAKMPPKVEQAAQKGPKMSELRKRLMASDTKPYEDDVPTVYEVTLDEDVAEWFANICKEFKKDPNSMIDMIMRIQMEDE